MNFYRWISLGEKACKKRMNYIALCVTLSSFPFFPSIPFLFSSFLPPTNLFRRETELSGIRLSVVNGISGFPQAKKKERKKKRKKEKSEKKKRERGTNVDGERKIRSENGGKYS